MGTDTGDIRAVEFTSSRAEDCPMLTGLLGGIPAGGEISTVTGNGGFDTRGCRSAIFARGG